MSITFTVTTPVALAENNPPFTAGVLHGALNGNAGSASFDVTCNDCGSFDVDVTGAYDQVLTARGYQP